MTSTPDDLSRSARIFGGQLVSRRDLLKAAGLVGVGLATAPYLAAWARPLLTDAAVAAVPADEPIATLAAALDYDAERILRFVADEIRYEPYSGVLRGARGTLASRAGNSADQALLLAALLKASLLPVRFAIGEIGSDIAEALLANAVADAETIQQHTLDALTATLPGQEPAPAQLTAEQQAQIDEAAANGDRVLAWGRDQLERTVGTITSALQEAGVELLDGFSPLPDSERARHVWVQLAQTADWLDLDPTLPATVPGMVATAAAETLDALPDEMAHRVELAIIGETLDGETLTEKTLVGYSERSDAIAGLPIAVLNTPPGAATALGISIAGALGGGSAYVPVIITGDTAVVGANPVRLAVAGPRGDTAENGEEFLDSGPSTGETTAEWVELTIRSPEAEPIVVRREIFDRLGPAKRAAGGVTIADLAPVDSIELPDDPQPHALLPLTSHWLTVSTGLPGRDDAVMTVVPGEDDRSGAVVSQAYHLAGAAAGLALAVPAGLQPFIDAPNVAAFSLVMRPSPDGQHAAEPILDIWHRSHRVVPVASVDAALAPAVAAGVLAHVSERILAGDAIRDVNEPGTSALASVGAVFDAAEADGISWRVLRGMGAADGLPWSDDARALLERSLADGWVAIAPEMPVMVGDRERVGWWLVDPHTGRTQDELDDGRGGSTFEEAATVAVGPVGYWNLAWRLFGCVLAVATGYVSAAVSLGMGGVGVQLAYAGDPAGAVLALLGGFGSGLGLGTGLGLGYFC